MNDDEIRSFLERPLVGVISTASAAGTPHSVPVWYRYDGSAFSIWTDRSRRWVRNLEQRGEVAIVIAEHQPPFAAVIVRGSGIAATNEPGTDEEIRAIARRYMAAGDVDGYAAQWASLRTIVRVTPRVLQSWGRGY